MKNIFSGACLAYAIKYRAKVFVVIFVLSAFATTAFANPACDILEQGNKYYKSKEYSKALDIYKMIEDIDKFGQQRCTDSVYATIATIYTIFGDRALTDNADKAALYYKTASRYNRAFAQAIACKAGKCEGSKKFWNR